MGSTFKGLNGYLLRLIHFGLRMLALLPLFTLSRLLLFWFSGDRFPDVHNADIWHITVHGMPYDLAAVMMVNSLYFVLVMLPWNTHTVIPVRKGLNVLFFASNAMAIALNIIDAGYFEYSLRRTSLQVFFLMRTEGGFLHQLPGIFRDYYFLFLLFALTLICLVLILRYIPGIRMPATTLRHSWPSWIIVYLIGAFLVFTAGRGGLQRRPLWLVTAGFHTGAGTVPLVTNTPFTLLKSLHKERLRETHFDWFEGPAGFSALHAPYPVNVNADSPPLNIVIMLFESFSAEYTGFLNTGLDSGTYKGYTPFLDSLSVAGKSYRAYANGTRSIEALPAVFCGLPNLMDRDYIQSVYADNRLKSIASMLKPSGYNSAFFHGGDNGTMSFDAFTGLVGFDRYFGRDEFDDDRYYDHNWGIFDHKFLEYMADQLDSFPQPFVAGVLTVSSHHPFVLPAGYSDSFADIPDPMHRSVRYADKSLELFMRQAAKTSWYKNTLFVITADHSSRNSRKEYNNILSRYAIPLIFYIPGVNGGGLQDGFAQQTDILPTLLEMSGYTQPHVSFGNSLLDSSYIPFAVQYSQEIYQLYRNDCVLRFNGDSLLSAYVIRDKGWSPELSAAPPKEVLKELDFLKTYINEYNRRMSGNQLNP